MKMLTPRAAAPGLFAQRKTKGVVPLSEETTILVFTTLAFRALLWSVGAVPLDRYHKSKEVFGYG